MRKLLTAAAGLALVAAGATAAHANPTPEQPDAMVQGLAKHRGITPAAARDLLKRQDDAHLVAKRLPASVQPAGVWFEPATGKLTVAVTTRAEADAARAAGADATMVARSKAELDKLQAQVTALAAARVPGLNSWGVDVKNNNLRVTVNRTKKTAATERFLAAVRALDGVVVIESSTSQRQQGGDVRTGSPWWPGGESNCSIGFSTTDSSGNKHMLTAGHCTNDRDQPAYGAFGQQNKMGTSNVGGTRSVNAREGDMGVVAVTEAGWNLSASVNTWDQPAVTVTGSAEAIVGDQVCHSGNTSKWQCGEVRYVNRAIDYGGSVGVIEGLTWTTACSKGGDSGGGWLRGDKAVGLHDGGPSQCVSNPGDDDMSIFQPVNEALTKWGLTLYTGTGGGDTEPPTTPGNPRATGTTDTTVSLAWDASVDNTGVSAYDVFRGGTLATTVTTTSATVTGLTANTDYSFTIQARDAAGNKSKPTLAVTAKTQPGGGGGRTFANGTDYPIRDYQVTISSLRSTATGPASNPVTVSMTAVHPCTQDLNITLVSPSGRYYPLQRYGGYPCTPFPGTKTWSVVPAPGEAAGGTWTLRIGDNGPDDIGTLDSWSVTV